VTKESLPRELVRAIRKAASGKKYISDSFAESVAKSLTHDDKPLHECLSNKEYLIFTRIVRGMETKEIAAELSLARSTISTYRGRIFEKMNMNTMGELVRYAIDNGLIK
jgi:two-component system, NarL family, invasion response regulator UvrY